MNAEAPATVWTPSNKVSKIINNFGTFKAATAPQAQQTGNIADLNQSPMPAIREIVRYEHTTYVEFQRRNNSKRGQGLTMAAFIKNVLALL